MCIPICYVFSYLPALCSAAPPARRSRAAVLPCRLYCCLGRVRICVRSSWPQIKSEGQAEITCRRTQSNKNLYQLINSYKKQVMQKQNKSMQLLEDTTIKFLADEIQVERKNTDDRKHWHTHGRLYR